MREVGSPSKHAPCGLERAANVDSLQSRRGGKPLVSRRQRRRTLNGEREATGVVGRKRAPRGEGQDKRVAARALVL